MYHIIHLLTVRTALLSASCALLLFGTAQPVWAAPHYNPGEWKYHWNTHIKMMGLSIPSIPVTATSCVKTSNPVPEPPAMKKSGCKIIDLKSRGNTLTYTAHCAMNSTVVNTHYRLAFHGDTVKGTFTQVRTTDGKVGSTANGTVNGQRIGSCTKKK